MTETRPARPRWHVAAADPARVLSLAHATGLSPVTAHVLVSRGIDTPDAVRAFLAPSLEAGWLGAVAIPGMDEAARRVSEAVRAGERIVVFGDFDLDGISSAALVSLGLSEMGATVEAMVPHRFLEGYGLTTASVERIASSAPDLVVTVDCGISSASEVEELRARGIDVVVTDHHEPGDGVPRGVPVADPKLAPGAAAVSGAGVALELVRAVGGYLGCEDAWRGLTDLAMLGTVADLVPLLGPNRALVSDGLARCRAGARPGVRALAAVAGVAVERMDAGEVAYGLAPRLNAAGRMADPALALELLTTTDEERARHLAEALDEHNRMRQEAEGDLLDRAVEQAERVFRRGMRSLVLAGEGWHEGVRGIVASRLVTRFGVPVVLFSVDGDLAQGSGRSVPGVDLHAAVAALSGLLTRYGGHAAAVGATLPSELVPAFAEGLERELQAYDPSVFETTLRVDAEVALDGLSRELAAELALLGPFGFDNPRPLLATRGVFMNGRKRVGRTAGHLRFTAFDGVASLPAIAFRCPDIEVLADTETAVDLAYELALDEWQGKERLQLLVRDVAAHEARPDSPAAELVEDLFAHADEIIARGGYEGIEDAEQFHTKLAGVTFEDRQQVVARLGPGTPLRLERQPENPYDPCACALFDPHGDQVGFFNRRLAAAIAPLVDRGVEYDVEVTEVTGGGEGESLGVNVRVAKRSAAAAEDEAVEAGRERRRELESLAHEELASALVRHFIGDGALHPEQSEALSHLARGSSTLLVMATGRGKSLVFHVHAALEALRSRRASVFVYPLRALVADQAFHLRERFADIGLSLMTVTGETPGDARADAFAALARGELDVVLTTPEFLCHHARRFADAGRVRFLVVDEAHHVASAHAGGRPAYGKLDRVLAELGGPTVLAATATAPDPVTAEIVRVLGVEELVLDPTVRDNLKIVDSRGTKDKASYLAALAARGGKVIVYVGSRESSVDVARGLRTRVPALSGRVAFYNGGMTRAARHAVEHAFREGDLSVVVATSAFGEGVNVGDVRHVVLYHLPMDEVAFNQSCGRAGRDGEPAWIHLLYGPKDARINELVLGAAAPSREDLAGLYLTLREAAAQDGGEVETTNADLAERVRRRRPGAALNESGVSTGLAVFRELGLIRSEGMGAYRRISVLPAPGSKLDLMASTRYAEGVDALAEFAVFKERALRARSDELLHAVNRPILPTPRPRHLS